jgi:predicted MFS family arabinose efflux permease
MAESPAPPKPIRLAPALVALTLARLVINGARRFPYAILTPLAASLSVPRAVLEQTLSAEWAAGALSPLVAGPAAERLGRKRTMLAALGLFTAVTGAAAVAPLAALALFALVALGFTKMLFDPAMQAYVGDRTPYQRRALAIGVTELSWSGALFTFGALAVFLVVQAGAGAIFAVLAAGGALAFGLIWVLVPEDRAGQPGTKNENRAPLNFRLLLAGRTALAILAISALMSVAAENMMVMYEAWLRQSFVLPTETFAGLTWMIGGAEIAGEILVIVVADRFGKRRLALLALVAAGLAYGALPLAGGSFFTALGGLLTMFFAFEVSIVVFIPLVTEALPAARGTMMSVNVAASALGRALGALTGGLLFRLGGYGLNGVAALALNLIAAALIWRCVRE